MTTFTIQPHRLLVFAALLLFAMLAAAEVASASRVATVDDGTVEARFDIEMGSSGKSRLTTLTPQGNQEVAERYRNWAQHISDTNSDCRAHDEAPRVLLTGFGLFVGIDFNPSGAVIDNLSNEKFWPAKQSLEERPHRDAPVPLARGRIDAAVWANVRQRDIKINGRDVHFCFVIVDVLWDFAGAVVIHEMEQFQPNLVIMTGLGDATAILESGAQNQAAALSGFAPNGNANNVDTPSLPEILSGGPSRLSMTWNNRKLADRVRPMIEKLGFRLQAPHEARRSNDYICNNLSYLALAAAGGFGKTHELSLAGGELKLTPKVLSNPQIGFMHYPLGIEFDDSSLASWAQVLMTLVDEALKPQSAQETSSENSDQLRQ